MAHYIGFQEFHPIEQKYDGPCIWCKRKAPLAQAHIISKKLVRTNHATNILNFSVCQKCNNDFGRSLENWILRDTPLGWARLYFYDESNRKSKTYVPSYFYDEQSQDWLIYELDNNRKVENAWIRTIVGQLIFKENQIRFVSEYHPDIAKSYSDKIFSDIRKGNFLTDTNPKYPENFSPRAIVDNRRVIVVARLIDDVHSFIAYIQNQDFETIPSNQPIKPVNSGKQIQHFKWDATKWCQFCVKIAFEELNLLEGAKFCLASHFDGVRDFAQKDVKPMKNIIFSEQGPLSNDDVPISLYLDISNGQNAPKTFLAPVFHISPGMHCVVICEIDGWICASVSISGFPPSFLVLGGSNLSLDTLYVVMYDNKDDQFHYLKLADNPNIPIIPLPIEESASFDTVTKTYKLRSINPQ